MGFNFRTRCNGEQTQMSSQLRTRNLS